MTMRIGRIAAAEERIQELERLLRGQLDELQRAAAARQEDRAARDLFATVAAFFKDLAEGGSGEGGDARLAGKLADLTARFPVINLASPDAPLATLCIAATAPVEPVYRCLAALHESGADRRAEVVVLDDGRADPANALLPTMVRNLRYQFLPGPDGFNEARNALAQAAETELLAFLAPQARLAGDWLGEIEATFADEPRAVAIGGRLLREDGLLHPAGLLLGLDGRLHDPAGLAPSERPEWRALRRVDALTGGAFAVRRDAFLRAGGFSALYSRTAHGTVDVCARLGAGGGEVLLQPMATALWIDGGEPVETPDFTIADEETLRLRERVAAHGWPGPCAAPVGRVLVLDDDLPRPDRDAGSIATFEQMLLLRRLGWHVTFAPLHATTPAREELDALARRGIVVAAPPAWPSVTAYLEQEGARLDLLHIYRYANARMLAERARELAPQAKIVLATADLHHLREQRRAVLAGRPVPEATRAAEIETIRAADAAIVTNDHERDLLAADPAASGARVVLLRWIARPVPPTTPFTARRDICFLGNFRHPPNLDGIRWFIEQMLPRLRSALPGVKLLLAGADMPASFGALAGEGVELLGWVPDLTALFGRVRVSVAPLRFGAGFKGKVATSLAHGLPVVGSSIALEGTGLDDGDGVAVADTPEDFVRAIMRLHEDENHWQAQSARALERVAALYSPDAALQIWRRLLSDLELPAAS
jgi:glycosyltransferase involved in cell wall biosynthesis